MPSQTGPSTAPLYIPTLIERYRAGGLVPSDLVDQVIARIDAGDPAVWIDRMPAERLAARAAELEAVGHGASRLPLYGIPFAVKDNIDVAGRPTTAGCPGYAYVASRSASAVEQLERAGAILIGKTNLDQFATGLVGTRSPYGVPTNPEAPDHIPGGSSSGSAVAVASGLVSFALGTDTAGSGRVPAAMTGIVGLKPTRGLVSAAGVVPACRSLDCVSVFAANLKDAALVAEHLQQHASGDAWARPPGDRTLRSADEVGSLRFGIPPLEGVEPALADAFEAAVHRLQDAGLELVDIDFEPFERAGRLLYEGPWLAERLAAVGGFVQDHPGEVLDVTRQVLEGGARFTATDVYTATDTLALLRRQAQHVFAQVDLIVVPSVPELTTLAQVADDPFGTNARLGRFTNFVNLLDLTAVAVPDGRVRRVPIGVTFVGPALTERTLLAVGRAFQSIPSSAGTNVARTAGPTSERRMDAPATRDAAVGRGRLVVVGAHLRGQPLHHQLVLAGARLVERTWTAPSYRLYRLDDPQVPKPGLVPDAAGLAIEVEVYELAPWDIECLARQTRAPLSIGAVRLANGAEVAGYVCDPGSVNGLEDISAYGGWREYLATR